MEAVEKRWLLQPVNPRNGNVVKRLKARAVFDLMATAAWKTCDPGLIFLDEINRKNPTPHAGIIEATNPCGEVPFSINLSRIVRNGEIDWERLRQSVRIAVNFLDNVIDANKYPILQIEKSTKANRKIGLGVMGFAEMLIKLAYPMILKKLSQQLRKLCHLYLKRLERGRLS